MALGKSKWQNYDRECKYCHTRENLTRHHVKNKRGKKTGEIHVLCRACHDQIEQEYVREGIVKLNLPPKLTRNEKLQLDYMNGLIPFYSLGGYK